VFPVRYELHFLTMFRINPSLKWINCVASSNTHIHVRGVDYAGQALVSLYNLITFKWSHSRKDTR
jgi:hypothetical protein